MIELFLLSLTAILVIMYVQARKAARNIRENRSEAPPAHSVIGAKPPA
ncbi:MAG: hypothetical protein VXW58_17300 [Pseudomonadota bacterium]|nr:hypothetical protein [Pseudomonadota bacterium]